jgi:hypothetical protein
MMTTFTDRERAIEAHYALLELVAFRERAKQLHLPKPVAETHAAVLAPPPAQPWVEFVAAELVSLFDCSPPPAH